MTREIRGGRRKPVAGYWLALTAGCFLLVLIGMAAFVIHREGRSVAVEHRSEASATQVDRGAGTLKGMIRPTERTVSDFKDNQEADVGLAAMEDEAVWMPDPQAIDSLQDALVNGDPRVPPIHPTDADERPTPDELSPEGYAGFEKRQDQKLKAAYVVAVDLEFPALERAIDEARQMGLPEEQLREGEEKLRRMREMRAQLLEEDVDLQVLVAPAKDK